MKKTSQRTVITVCWIVKIKKYSRKLKKEVGENMKRQEFAYCNECEELVNYDICEDIITEQYKGEEVKFKFIVGRCKCCGNEVSTDNEYNFRKSEAKIKAYKKKIGIIDIDQISEILRKYDIGKEALADIAGFGKVTIKRYYEGFIPAKEYSDILVNILNDEELFMNLVQKSKDKLKEVTYKKIVVRYERLVEIRESKIDQIVNYIITHLGEVTPLALEKLLSFCNGVNYAVNGKQLIFEESQAWAHGPVYPYIYNKYKKYGYRPIDNGIYSSHGWMTSKLLEEEIRSIDMVIRTFGLYSPKTLEMISHSQRPWKEKRVRYKENESSQEVIDEKSIKEFYVEKNLCTEEKIMRYILECIRNESIA